MTQFEALVSELATATGLPLEADAHDACSLENDGLVITLQYRRECDDVALFAPVTDPDAELPSETLRKALALACNGEGTRGAYLGLFDGTLLLSTFMSIEGMDAETLGGRILAFADTAHAVRDSLDASAAEPADGVASGDDFQIPTAQGHLAIRFDI